MSESKQRILDTLWSLSSGALREIADACENTIEERLNDGVFD